MPGELEVVNLSPHDALVCRLEHDGQKIEEGALVFIQVLYTKSLLRYSIVANNVSSVCAVTLNGCRLSVCFTNFGAAGVTGLMRRATVLVMRDVVGVKVLPVRNVLGA